MYLKRKTRSTFRSVILAGVYDIKNLKLKICSKEEEQYNSLWNIAADFNVDMSFKVEDIVRMLQEYGQDVQMELDVDAMARLIYEYTSGYPFLVSYVCKIVDEQLLTPEDRTWSEAKISEGARRTLANNNTLFDDMEKKISDFPELRRMLYDILFHGQEFPFNLNNQIIGIGNMFGFVKEENGQAVISNRIFETWFYNLFISQEALQNQSYKAAAEVKNQFVTENRLDMERVLVKFMEHYAEIYEGCSEHFKEE